MVLEAIKSNVLKTGCLQDTFTDDGITNSIHRSARFCFEFKLVVGNVHPYYLFDTSSLLGNFDCNEHSFSV
jgi:hypothetical protein